MAIIGLAVRGHVRGVPVAVVASVKQRRRGGTVCWLDVTVLGSTGGVSARMRHHVTPDVPHESSVLVPGGGYDRKIAGRRVRCCTAGRADGGDDGTARRRGALDRGLVTVGERSLACRRLLLFGPRVAVVRVGQVRVPAAHAAEVERRALAVAGRHVAREVRLPEADGLAADAAHLPVLGHRRVVAAAARLGNPVRA